MGLEPDDLYAITRHAKIAQVRYALASLGIPDALDAGELSAEQVVERHGVR